MTIDLPQSAPSREYVTGLDDDGNITTKQPKYSELSFVGVFGPKVISTSQNTIDVGVKTWDTDENIGLAIDDPVQITCLDSDDCYMYGIVTGVTNYDSTQTIVVLCLKSNGTLLGNNFEIQKVPNFASEIGALYGYSSTSLQFGASHDIFVGASVTLTTDASKLFGLGSHVITTSPTDSTQFFRGISIGYSGTLLSIFVTDVGSAATGTIAAWVVYAQDGPSTPTLLSMTSSTSVAPGSKSVGSTVSFQLSTYTPFFADHSGTTAYLVLAYSASDPGYFITGRANYAGGFLGVNVFAAKPTSGSTAKADWIIQILTPMMGVQDVKGAGIKLFSDQVGFNNQNSGGSGGVTVTSNKAASITNSTLTLSPVGQNDLLTLAWGSGGSSPVLTVAGTGSIIGTNTGDQNVFTTIAVSGQSNVVSDQASDTLTLVGSGIAITTNAGTDTITLTNSGALLAFKTISVSGQSDVVADSATDTLTLVAGDNISIANDASSDTITFKSFVNSFDYGSVASGAGSTSDYGSVTGFVTSHPDYQLG